MVKLVQPTDEGLQFIARTMRREDIVEVNAMGGYTPHRALKLSLEMSSHNLMVVADDGTPLTLLGVSPGNLLLGIGVPWLLSSRHALRHRSEFLRLSRPVVDQMLQHYPKLINYVHAENKLSIRWLKWLGFQMDDAVPMGVYKELFHRFYKERTDV